jgi:hypothetical protein
MNKNMPNKANFQKSQIFIMQVLTRNYNEKMKMDTWSKQTQSKPILPAIAGKIAPLFRMLFILMGPALSLSNGRELSKQLLPHPLNPYIMPLLYGDKNGKT